MPQTVFFGNLPAPTPLYKCHQDLRVSIVDPCGNLMPPITLGKGYDVTATKDSQDMMGGTYVIIHK